MPHDFFARSSEHVDAQLLVASGARIPFVVVQNITNQL